MLSFNTFILLVSCLLFTAKASHAEVKAHSDISFENEPQGILTRQRRSPEGGNVDLTYKKDQFGREASVDYNHNLYKSGDGRGTIDAYAQASRNFDHNRNDFGGGVRGSWRF